MRLLLFPTERTARIASRYAAKYLQPSVNAHRQSEPVPYPTVMGLMAILPANSTKDTSITNMVQERLTPGALKSRPRLNLRSRSESGNRHIIDKNVIEYLFRLNG